MLTVFFFAWQKCWLYFLENSVKETFLIFLDIVNAWTFSWTRAKQELFDFSQRSGPTQILTFFFLPYSTCQRFLKKAGHLLNIMDKILKMCCYFCKCRCIPSKGTDSCSPPPPLRLGRNSSNETFCFITTSNTNSPHFRGCNHQSADFTGASWLLLISMLMADTLRL